MNNFKNIFKNLFRHEQENEMGVNHHDVKTKMEEFLTVVYLDLYNITYDPTDCAEDGNNLEEKITIYTNRIRNAYKEIVAGTTLELLGWVAATTDWVFKDRVLLPTEDPYKAKFEPGFERILTEWLGVKRIVNR